jgi:hypothetical protein
LLEEFSYARLLPRQQRVRVFLGGLLGWSYDFFGAASPFAPGAPAGDIQALVYLLNLGGPLIPTLSVEDQLASQQVLGTDGALLDAQWRAFWSSALQNTRPLLPGTTQAQPQPFWPLWEWKPDGTTPPIVPGGLGNLLVADSIGSALPHGQQLVLFGPGGPLQAQQAPWRIGVVNDGGTPITATGSVINASYAERMIQTDLLMPVIAQDASRAGDDLTAIGFTAAEQETTFAWFWSAVDADLLTTAPVPVPSTWSVLTMNPIPVYMTVADILDWAQTLAGPASADQLRNAGALGLNLICDQADELFWLVLAMLDPTASAQIPALADTEVQLELVSLATDLNTLANLAY